eukprot:CAMPEP_0113672124 /NCGR_PEP_ID=MMETSP0038_2-20120614/6085_1 /TAXON_ID=2898 /ORGANISM="Cryptomonas paramecium" /LENGTH=289 /DNA_ID=CAMNT_0000588351 /DNA_START=223 /DNA_END=1092 /DNA_ORIENTATION=+ /assembly_acc=CAM_ASM_000170
MRAIVCADALAWLSEQKQLPGSLFTSLPDIIELDLKGKEDEYKEWFLHAASLALRRLPPGGFAIFYQTDVKVFHRRTLSHVSRSGQSCREPQIDADDGNADASISVKGKGQSVDEMVEWIDKSFLCAKAAEAEDCVLAWRKVVVKGATEAKNNARPSYTHLICFRKRGGEGPVGYHAGRFLTPDIVPRGIMVWPRAIGLDATMLGLRFLREVAGVTCVIDPFCGQGTIPAAANALGMKSIGVDLSPARCRLAKRLDLLPLLSSPDYSDDDYRGAMRRLRFPLQEVRKSN